jgi:uncharacterized phage infection (PIP) family protein YhgE
MSIFDQISEAPGASEPTPPVPPVQPPVIEHREVPGDPPKPVVQRRGGTPFLVTLVLFAALGGGLYWVWKHPGGQVEQAAPVSAGGDDGQAIAAAKADLAAQLQAQGQSLGQQIQALAARVDALEKQQAAPPPAPTAAPAPAAPAAPEDAGAVADLAKKLDDVTSQLAALSAKQDAQAAEIQKSAEIAAQKPAEPAAAPPDNAAQTAALAQAQQQVADLSSKLDQSQAQTKAALDQLAAQQKDALAQSAEVQKAALDAVDARIGKLEQGAGQAQGAAQDATRAIRLEAAQAALDAGQPLGTIPDAPPPLARFATTAPPTEGALRVAFPAVAAAAAAASTPDVENKGFFDRALARLQQSVTVRQGDHVIVGDPASGILARAQDDVNNGDLKAAVQVLGGLKGAAAGKVADWVAQVNALLEARAALAALAAHG